MCLVYTVMCVHPLHVVVLLGTLQYCIEYSIFISTPGCPEASIKAVVMMWLVLYCKIKNVFWDFPDDPVVKNLSCNAGDVGSIPGKGTTIPHASKHVCTCACVSQLLSLCSRPESCNYIEALGSKISRSSTREATRMRSLSTATRE